MPALAFFHISIPEYKEVWRTKVCYGHRLEREGSPRINSGMFAAMIEEGGIMGTFVGHDHSNDYWGELHGIRLCYGRSTGYNAYAPWLYPRGARVIRLQEKESGRFTTWLRLGNGKKIAKQRKHSPWNPVSRLLRIFERD
ncbi:metallophosphoesterase family protein [Cohnella kolymensis]|uniref:hypothetical protein n=1 Tax=Cohnella kolymensis TaxID=1590652 RepID=UPI000ADB5B01